MRGALQHFPSGSAHFASTYPPCIPRLAYPSIMFQVASHPSTFAAHGHGHQHSHHSSHHSSAHGSHGVSLPRTLQRPQFYDIPARNIAAVAPDLAGVPLEYVRRGIYPRAREMIGGISTLNVPSTMPANHLPKHLNVGCRASPSVSYPTHLLAVCASKASGDVHAKLVPTHALVLAAHCALVEPLDDAQPQPGGNALPLRVVRMSVPSPAAFPILHAYMYNHRTESVVQALFPAFPAAAVRAFATHQGVLSALGSGQAKHNLAVQLLQAEGGNLGRLTADAAHVKEAWQDMVSLGMYDAQLWDTIDLCWEVVLAALNLAATQ